MQFWKYTDNGKQYCHKLRERKKKSGLKASKEEVSCIRKGCVCTHSKSKKGKYVVAMYSAVQRANMLLLFARHTCMNTSPSIRRHASMHVYMQLHPSSIHAFIYTYMYVSWTCVYYDKYREEKSLGNIHVIISVQISQSVKILKLY